MMDRSHFFPGFPNAGAPPHPSHVPGAPPMAHGMIPMSPGGFPQQYNPYFPQPLSGMPSAGSATDALKSVLLSSPTSTPPPPQPQSFMSALFSHSPLRTVEASSLPHEGPSSPSPSPIPIPLANLGFSAPYSPQPSSSLSPAVTPVQPSFHSPSSPLPFAIAGTTVSSPSPPPSSPSPSHSPSPAPPSPSPSTSAELAPSSETASGATNSKQPDPKAVTHFLIQRQKTRASQPQEEGAGRHSLEGRSIEFKLGDSPQQQSYSSDVDGKYIPQVTPVTLLITKLVYRSGSSIAANARCISYVVREQIRVIDLTSGRRDSLKQHSQAVIDVSFFGSSNILASVAEDGCLIIWELIFEEGAEPTHRIIFSVQLEPGASPRFFQRVVFHPSTSTVFATYTSDAKLQVWNIANLIAGATSPVVFTHSKDIAPAAIPNQEQPMDMAFSPDGFVLGVASADGLVTTYAVTQAEDNGHPKLSLLTRWNPHRRSPVFSVKFLKNFHILTSCTRNSEIKLWQAQHPNKPAVLPPALVEERALAGLKAGDPLCLQTIVLQSHDGTNENLYNIICADPAGECIFVANARNRLLTAFHLFAGNPNNPYSSRFNRLTEIEIIFPITSFFCYQPPEQKQFVLYCVQTRAIQLYHIPHSVVTSTEQPADLLDYLPYEPSSPIANTQSDEEATVGQAANFVSTSPDNEGASAGNSPSPSSSISPPPSPQHSTSSSSPSPTSSSSSRIEHPDDGDLDNLDHKQSDNLLSSADSEIDHKESPENQEVGGSDEPHKESGSGGSDQADQECDAQPNDNNESLDLDDLQDLVPPSAFLPPKPEKDGKRRRPRRERRRSTVATGTSGSGLAATLTTNTGKKGSNIDLPGQIMILSRPGSLSKGELLSDTPVEPALPSTTNDVGATFSSSATSFASTFVPNSTSSESLSTFGARFSPMHGLEATIVPAIEDVFKRHEARLNLERAEQEQRTLLTINQTIGSQIDKAVQREIANNIVPLFNRTVTQQLQATLPKLVEPIVVKTMQKVIAPRVERFVEQTLSKDLLRDRFPTLIRQPLSEAVRGEFEASLIPAFEQATQQMFHQIEAAFQSQFRDLLENTVVEEIQKATDAATQELRSTTSSLASLSESVARTSLESQQALLEIQKAAAQTLQLQQQQQQQLQQLQQQSHIIQQFLQQAHHQAPMFPPTTAIGVPPGTPGYPHAAAHWAGIGHHPHHVLAPPTVDQAMRSAIPAPAHPQFPPEAPIPPTATPPSPVASSTSAAASVKNDDVAKASTTMTPELQALLKEIVAQQRFEEAFEKALTANNLNLVIWLCSMTDPVLLFKSKPPLVSQAVALSLIQHLSFDLSPSSPPGQTPLKLAWLQAATEVLDPTEKYIQSYVPKIINGLHDKLAVLIRELPPELSSKARNCMHFVKFAQSNFTTNK